LLITVLLYTHDDKQIKKKIEKKKGTKTEERRV
jgi:hypothetical protein